ncbi:MAG: VIT1/CCC1 transporter family protein [Acidobacteriota bacterium]
MAVHYDGSMEDKKQESASPGSASIDRHQADHTPEAVRRRLHAGPSGRYLRDFIYGGIDGAVTTFAVVAGVAGARLASSIVVVLGVANLLADGFSMAVSNYLGTRAEGQQRERLRMIEEEHIERYPEGEREEVRQIFAAKGFVGDDLERVVAVITAERERWVETMLNEEHGFSPSGSSPGAAAAITFAAFVVVGALPLLTFVWQVIVPPELEITHPFVWSSILTGVSFFVVGAAKSRFVGQSWLIAGLETLAMGSVAAVLAYVVGALLRGLVGGGVG